MGRAVDLQPHQTQTPLTPLNPPYRDPTNPNGGEFLYPEEPGCSQALISLGANVNAQTDAGFTALHLVAHLVQRLLGEGVIGAIEHGTAVDYEKHTFATVDIWVF